MSVLCVIDKDNILIHMGAPNTFTSNELGEYIKNGYTIKSMTIMDLVDSGYRLYHKIPEPPVKP